MMWFEKLCKLSAKHFLWAVGDVESFKNRVENAVSRQFMNSLKFTGMDVEPHEVILASYVGTALAFLISVAIDIIIFYFHGFSIESIDILTLVLMVITTVGLPLAALQFLSEYPKTKARYMKIHSLGDIPEVLSYIVMYLKLIPNMEDGIRFAAKESNTSLGKDLKKLVWDVEVRVYRSMDDAVASFANLWGKWSDYLKRSIHLIRSAVGEKSKSERNVTLDRALDIVMEGTKDRMADFVNKLHQPTLIIYSIGVMIPLALIAMMPASSIVGLKVSVFQIFLLYDVILPLALFFYIKKILLLRPATFNPPVIPRSHPDLNNVDRKKNFMEALAAGIFISIPGIFFVTGRMANAKIASINLSFFGTSLSYCIPSTLFLLWGMTAAISIYCLKTYAPYKKIRDEIREMENEFSDSLYVIGKRIEEGKPAEEAFHYASKTMEGSKMGRIFALTSFNLTSIRTNLHDALFDKKFGSLRHIYSDRIRAVMHLFVEGMKKSYGEAGTAAVKMAEHLKQLQEVERRIKNSLGTLTAALRSTATVFAPLIAGITLGITKLISEVVGNMDLGGIPENDFISGVSNFSFNIDPEYFVLVIGIYVAQLVFLLIRFANGIDGGDDRVEYMYSVGKAMPTAISLFGIVTVISMILFGVLSPSF